jgi:AraC family transcriptional regulator of adaptative response / DNA-3-methyladenine glycosylase II
VRRQRGKAAAGVRLSLSYRPPYDFAALLDFYRVHRVADLEHFDGGSYRRLVALDGKVGWVTVRDDPERYRLWVDVDFPDTAQLHVIVGRVRRMFDVDCDPVLVANSLEADPDVKRIWRRHPGIRLPSGWDGFEVAVGTILGQVVSLERARALLRDLVELCGEPSGIVMEGRPVKLFPGPAVLARADLGPIRTTGARKRTVRELARAIVDGRISLESAQDVGAFTESLCALPGIGPWSASYIALKVLRHTDAFPETDLILARALERHRKEVVDAMSPWRGYAAALFWREYAASLSKAPRRKS